MRLLSEELDYFYFSDLTLCVAWISFLILLQHNQESQLLLKEIDYMANVGGISNLFKARGGPIILLGSKYLSSL